MPRQIKQEQGSGKGFSRGHSSSETSTIQTIALSTLSQTFIAAIRPLEMGLWKSFKPYMVASIHSQMSLLWEPTATLAQVGFIHSPYNQLASAFKAPG